MTTDFPNARVCRQFFVVPSAGWSKRHGEMIRIDDERRAGGVRRQFFPFENIYRGKVMHEGGWEPFVHHFSSVLGGVVLQDEETRSSGR